MACFKNTRKNNNKVFDFGRFCTKPNKIFFTKRTMFEQAQVVVQRFSNVSICISTFLPKGFSDSSTGLNWSSLNGSETYITHTLAFADQDLIKFHRFCRKQQTWWQMLRDLCLLRCIRHPSANDCCTRIVSQRTVKNNQIAVRLGSKVHALKVTCCSF